MDLHSGLPYWLVTNGLLADLPPLSENLPDEDIVIIGSGISGAFIAHELSMRGARCTMVDSRMLSTGSTLASTAHLNYEIDSSFQQLIEWYGEPAATAIYQINLESISRIEQILTSTQTHAGLARRDSLCLATDRKGERMLRKEQELRSRHGLPGEIILKDQLKADWKISASLALHHSEAAELDPYRAASGIIRYHALGNGLKVFPRTRITKIQSDKKGVRLLTQDGKTIKARQVVCAAGYESALFLPKKVAQLHSTYVVASQPLLPEQLWKNKALIWETARPYHYIRTTAENRIMIGGEDIPFKSAALRDAVLKAKETRLLAYIKKIFPQLKDVAPDFSWCGTFGETDDGLPYVGSYPGLDHVHFAIGYGGNGTTFSQTAAEIIANTVFGKPDARATLFSFERKRH